MPVPAAPLVAALLLAQIAAPPSGAVPDRDDGSLRAPDELGSFPVLLYHHVGPEEGRWTRTPEGLRHDLETLHARGYRPVSVADVVAGDIDLPRGLSPVVVTFDDASPGQFRILPDGSVDPRSAVGVIEAFAAEHPEWRGGATFCLLSAADNGNAFFGDERTGVPADQRRRKMAFLVERGYELCNHTWWHGRLDRRGPDAVREQIGRGWLAIDSVAPGAPREVFALPLGVWPEDRTLALEGSWTAPDGRVVRWRHAAVLLAGSRPTPSPHAPGFDPHALQRMQVIGGVEAILRRIEREGRYVSDGRRGRVADPRSVR